MSLLGHSRPVQLIWPTGLCPLPSDSDRIVARQRNDALGHKQTHAPQQTTTRLRAFRGRVHADQQRQRGRQLRQPRRGGTIDFSTSVGWGHHILARVLPLAAPYHPISVGRCRQPRYRSAPDCGAMSGIFPRSFLPVSYTHLDVYKRQQI